MTKRRSACRSTRIAAVKQAAQFVRVDSGNRWFLSARASRAARRTIGPSSQRSSNGSSSPGRRGLVSGEYFQSAAPRLLRPAADPTEQPDLITRLDALIKQGDRAGFQRGPLRSFLRRAERLHPRNWVVARKRRQGQVKEQRKEGERTAIHSTSWRKSRNDVELLSPRRAATIRPLAGARTGLPPNRADERPNATAGGRKREEPGDRAPRWQRRRLTRRQQVVPRTRHLGKGPQLDGKKNPRRARTSPLPVERPWIPLLLPQVDMQMSDDAVEIERMGQGLQQRAAPSRSGISASSWGRCAAKPG